ncbi:MAG: hypothetical protein K2X87_28475 [Gemmataceae bacterium]|nr:hypothetical protein [Gemmataceae bacterium]
MVRRSLVLRAGPAAGLLLLAALAVVAVMSDRRTPPRRIDPKPRTTAELLVGTWRQVEQDQIKFPADGPGAAFVTFAADGRVTAWAVDEWDRPRVPGTYRLDGNKLNMSLEATADQEATGVSWVILKVNDRELVGDRVDGWLPERFRHTRVVERKR